NTPTSDAATTPAAVTATNDTASAAATPSTVTGTNDTASAESPSTGTAVAAADAAAQPAADAAGQQVAQAAAADATAQPVAEPTATDAACSSTATNAPVQPGGVIPLIVMDDVPLTDAIKNLARQAGLNYILDPKVAFGQPGPDGRPIPQPSVSIRWENVTAV